MLPDIKNIEMDKCTANLSIRVPEVLKADYERLDRVQKNEFVVTLIVIGAEYINMANFDPRIYLKSQTNFEQEEK